MTDAMYNNALPDDRAALRKILEDDGATAATSPRVRAGRLKRFGHMLGNVATSKKTHDFLIGAAVSGAISTSTRLGVLGAAGVMGVSMLPATLIAAGSAGAAVGAYRLYKDYKKEKADGTWEGWSFEKSAKKLLVSTMLSTLGGGAGYMVFNHGDLIAQYAGKAKDVVVGVLQQAGVIDVATQTYDATRGYTAAAINWLIPGGTEVLASFGRKIAEGGAALAASVGSYDYTGKIASAFTGVKQTLTGWGASLKALYAAAPVQETPVAAIDTPEIEPLPQVASEDIVARNDMTIASETPDVPTAEMAIDLPEIEPLPPVTSEDILARIDVTPVVETADAAVEEVVQTNPFEPRPVKTSVVLPDGTIISREEQARMAAEAASLVADFDPRRIADAFADMQLLQRVDGADLGVYLPELDIYPKAALEFTSLPKAAFSTATEYSMGEISQEVTAAVDIAQDAPRLVESFETQRIANAFDAMDLQVKPAIPGLSAYLPDLDMYPQTALAFPDMPAGALEAAPVYTLGADVQDVTANASADFVLGTEVITVANTGTFAENFGGAFEGVDLSSRAQRALEAAMDGTDQQRKDLAMNILNGKGGFEKNPELAASMYKFLLEDTRPAAGERASQTHMQVVRDTAYLMFHGKGIEADPVAAKALLEDIAPRSKVARAMLAEWNGERPAGGGATARAAVTHASAGGKGGLNCEFISAGNKVVSGTCDFAGNMPLRVGDRISLTP